MKSLKKPLILLFFLGFIIAGIAAFFMLNSKPDSLTDAQKEEAIGNILGRKPNLNPDIKTGDAIFEGKLIIFSYPARAKIYEYVPEGSRNNTTEIDRFSFDLEKPRLIFNYTASEKPALKALTDEPGVKLRQDASRGYVSEEVELDGQNGKSYKKEAVGGNRAEQTAYILNDGVLHTISISGASLEDASELFEGIINSATFK